ncbi:bifunctional 4-hydroxy-2-oxoglutarate aldolase/2-dehydro-3-deoxy-phosphogluconate aldolase [Aquibacillus koreensis]|uniref:Bifunctional 4-hydroxy-2-oxoglutarate aldolase/2-dehydro-3-deoxy-phosphogluconate aldolase n=1 Tax=Aquibacillus koreensis TaxID=279446 RepID=A0A9X3WNV0_9BACI|nr:bifunctional 4-hydroxy-2-oxoglutarate aldolase/2-dehydro-3-deoxy-phosphogluconate aldolase [Aquibacillus koreensis]MCT2537021.1 bifunctional 4-hydroxy-2-oxoglutarate aldolase/2-dehydro-3-deoxy-phosphogluconate aldolase [Aquibacillus koreensis]MDC3422325.1 bifunctional 4-hydroxy-2-oxoglutarate aldolase/2-dehydro-3-deoxy-phosphogluconate aldolase [Aquibacillus koreensis]
MKTLDRLIDSGVVAVIRKATPDTIIPIAKALSAGGVKGIEITVETPGALAVIEKAAKELGDDDAIVGAGTVLDAETARMALMAGAKFVFSPTVNVETIKMTKRYGAVCVAGAFTPTEILTAYENGSDLIKVFPASVVGPRFFKDVRGPLPQIPLMPTGGIDVDNVGEYIKNGAVAVGAGSTLVKATDNADEAYCKALTEKAKQFVAEVKKARGLA